MNRILPFCIIIGVLACRGDDGGGGSCVKATINQYSSGDFEYLENNRAFGGYVAFKDDDNENVDESNYCTQTLLTTFESLADTGVGYFLTSRHCINWFTVNLDEAELYFLDPEPKKQDHLIKIKLIDNPLAQLQDLRDVINQESIDFLNEELPNLAVTSCNASHYASQFEPNEQEKARKEYYKKYFLGDGEVNESISDTADAIFKNIPCFNALDSQIIKFAVKNPDKKQLEYLKKNYIRKSGDFDLKNLFAAESDWFELAFSVLQDLSYINLDNQKFSTFDSKAKKNKIYENVTASKKYIKSVKQSGSKKESKATIERNYQQSIFEFLIKREAEWQSAFNAGIQGSIDRAIDLKVFVHTNARIVNADDEVSHFTYLTIDFGDLAWIKDNIQRKRIDANTYGGFTSGTSIFYRPRPRDSESNKDAFGIDFGKSDSGSLVTINKSPIASLTSVGKEPVVKASTRIANIGDQINAADVDYYKEEFAKIEREQQPETEIKSGSTPKSTVSQNTGNSEPEVKISQEIGGNTNSVNRDTNSESDNDKGSTKIEKETASGTTPRRPPVRKADDLSQLGENRSEPGNVCQ